jgi:hypothetical protein
LGIINLIKIITMRIQQEFREERNDIYSFWELKKELNESKDGVIELDTKICETTLIELLKKVEDYQNEIIKINENIEIENLKIKLLNKFEN